MSDKRTFRCAVYTRKSTEEGLEQDFNSLDAQREACEAFIKSQAQEGWKPVRQRYDDGGCSGGTMDRPGLQALLADIRARQVDVVVVYKIDRLTRSLTDFARIVEVFEAHGTSFVSVTQAFNTTTSMGRLTLNVLLSFAQFEREVTAERIRDKIAASKKKGMWMGGAVPLGYEVKNRELIVNEAEAETVRTIYRLYLELGTVGSLKQRADELGLVTKLRRSASGATSGGAGFSRGHLYSLLCNPLYTGRIAHRGATYPGRHAAIVDQGTWDAVQQQLAENGPGRGRASNAAEPSLLTGLVYDEIGDRLSPSHAVKKGRRYRYYISHRLMQATRRKGDGWRLPARELERTMLDCLAGFLGDATRLLAELNLPEVRPDQLQNILAKADAVASNVTNGPASEQQDLLRQIIDRIDLKPGELRLRIHRTRLFRLLAGDANPIRQYERREATIDLIVPIALRRRGVEARLIIGNGLVKRTSAPDNKLIRLIATAHASVAQLTSGRTAPAGPNSNDDGLDRTKLSRTLSLGFLAPDIVQAFIDGRQPPELRSERLKRLCPLPLAWIDQRRALGMDGSDATS
jgi:site-specific DNA recombinase